MSDVSTAADQGGVDNNDVVVDQPPAHDAKKLDASVDEEGPVDLEEEAIRQREEEARAGEEEDAEADADADDADTDEGEEDQTEVEEFDFGGNKLQLPKGSVPDELRDKIESFTKDIWSDYTRKNQTVSDKAKEVETREGVVNKLSTLTGSALESYSRGLAVRQELEQLSQIDMVSLWDEDPDQARIISDTISAKQAQLQTLVSQVNEYETQAKREEQAELARRLDVGQKIIEKAIPNFDGDALVKYAVENGIDEDDAKTYAANPAIAIMGWKARQWDMMQAKAKATPKPQSTAPRAPVKAPASRGTAGNTVRDPEKMTDAQFRRHIGLPAD